MVGTKFASLTRKYAKADSNILPDADLLLFANAVKDDLANEISNAVDENYFEVPATTNLVEDQREYPFPSDTLDVIHRVEAILDEENWIVLSELFNQDIDFALTETNIVNKFGNGEGQAFYKLTRSAIYLFTGSVPAYSDGLKLWFNAYPQDLSAGMLADSDADLSEAPSTTTHGVPRATHEVWARETAFRWKEGRISKYRPTYSEQKLHGFGNPENGDWMKAVKSLRQIQKGRVIVAEQPDPLPENDGYDL
jgi:hypothetical protein